MATDIERKLSTLQSMNTPELCRRYAELHGQPARTRHRQYLIRKIAWRIQALAEGDLSERARRRAAELANDAEVRVMPPRTPGIQPPGRDADTVERVANVSTVRDPRLPAPGTAIVRKYKGQAIRVLVASDGDGFEYEGERFKTLTAVAKAITGTHINGYRFFRLENER